MDYVSLITFSWPKSSKIKNKRRQIGVALLTKFPMCNVVEGMKSEGTASLRRKVVNREKTRPTRVPLST